MDNEGLYYEEDLDWGESVLALALPGGLAALTSQEAPAQNQLDTDTSSAYKRSFSHPPERPYVPLDVNTAIHDEIKSNPLGTIDRRQRRRNRYAVYFPDDGPFESFGQFYDNQCCNTGNYKYVPSVDHSDYTGNIYATYRRAPRTYPRLDTLNIVRNDISDEPSQFSRRKSTDAGGDQFLPKLANEEVNNTESNANTGHSAHHKPVEEQSSVQHLFSIKLNDVKQMNTADDNSAKSNTTMTCGDLKTRVCKFVSAKCKKRNSGGSMEKKKKPSEKVPSKKAFFYCRWVTGYPKTLFRKSLFFCFCFFI